MALILSIDTSMEEAAVCIAEGGNIIAKRTNGTQSDHAAWIHTAITEMIIEAHKTVQELSAIAVAAGPGSYTGLRVGMSTAKGFCYALNVPLITESTLKLTAYRVKKERHSNFRYTLPVLICPMIDARRMEVFFAAYNVELREIIPASSLILDESSFSTELESNTIIFCGNGGVKWQSICNHPNAVFVNLKYKVHDLAEMAAEKFKRQEFTELVYSEPAYLKAFYTGKKT